MQKPIWLSAGQTDIGTVRKVNEDNYFQAPQVMLWAVADGMGGHEKGDLASCCIVEKLSALVTSQNSSLSVKHIIDRIEEANTELFNIATQTNAIIGSTVAILYFEGNKAYSIWAGDSRVYLLRNNQIKKLTRDHSHVEELLDAGLITEKQAENHPKSNIITRAVGTSEKIDLEISTIELQKEDAFLLCTDGLNKTMSDGEIENTLNRLQTSDVPPYLIDLALARRAKDNISIVFVSDENRQGAINTAIDGDLEATLL